MLHTSRSSCAHGPQNCAISRVFAHCTFFFAHATLYYISRMISLSRQNWVFGCREIISSHLLSLLHYFMDMSAPSSLLHRISYHLLCVWPACPRPEFVSSHPWHDHFARPRVHPSLHPRQRAVCRGFTSDDCVLSLLTLQIPSPTNTVGQAGDIIIIQ